MRNEELGMNSGCRAHRRGGQWPLLRSQAISIPNSQFPIPNSKKANLPQNKPLSSDQSLKTSKGWFFPYALHRIAEAV